VLLEISSQMRSYAASVLYELGARYLTSPGRLTMREDVIWWASVLTGRSDITTVDYRILHRDTIKKALGRAGHAVRRLQAGNRRAQARPQG
jgi:hypothetical protein